MGKGRINKADAKRAERRRKRRQRSAVSDQQSDDGKPTPKQAPGRQPRARAQDDPAGQPPSGQRLSAADRHRAQAAKRSRERYAEDAEIDGLPPVANPARRARCERDFWGFVHEYCKPDDWVEFGEVHRSMATNMEQAVLEGGLFAQSIARGYSKTTFAIWLVVWAVLYGHRRYVVLFGFSKPLADDLLEDVKAELLENDKLLEDFPEVCVALREINGTPQRAKSQTFQGKKTGAEWSTDRVILPTCGESAAGGAIIQSRPKYKFRGLAKRAKGSSSGRLRPDFFLADDVEDDESAASPRQREKLVSAIFKGWIPLVGHFGRMAGVFNGTLLHRDAVIAQATDPANARFGEWQKSRTKMVKAWAEPEGHKLWLGGYRDRLQAFAADDDEADVAARRKRATAFYEANRDVMDRGFVGTWEGAGTPDELSEVQHAYNLLIKLGEEAFETECQNAPPKNETDTVVPPASVIARKQHGLEPGVIDPAMTHVVSYIDQQDSVLYWLTAAFGDHLTGHVVEYGTWPNQNQRYFTLSSLPVSLQEHYRQSPLPEHGGPGAELDTDAALTAGLNDLWAILDGRRYALPGGGVKAIDLIATDIANGNRRKVITTAMLHSPFFGKLIGSQGEGIGAKRKPMAEWTKKPGERHGQEWVLRTEKATGVPYMVVNRNFHMRAFFEALKLPMGSVGCFSLPKVSDAADHQLLADHCQAVSVDRETSETWQRTVTVFTDKPGEDNHWLDDLVSVRPLAMIAGALPPGVARPVAAAAPKPRKRKARKL